MPVHVWGLVRLSLAKRWELLLGLGGGKERCRAGAATGCWGREGGRMAGRRQELLPVQAVGSARVFSWLTFKSGRKAARVLIVAGS